MQDITQESVLAALRRLQLEGMYGSWPKDGGICAYVYARHTLDLEGRKQVDAILKPVFSKWPKYSGNIWYPVPHPFPDEYADEDDLLDIAEHAFEDEFLGEMWTGEYGALRKELLAFCIEKLAEEIEG